MKSKKNIIIPFLLSFVLMSLGTRVSAQINTDQVMTIGKNALYFEDYVLSIQYFNQVIKVKPYLAEPYFFRAVAKLSLEDYRGAEEDATMAIERNKFITDAYQVRGIARQTMNKNKEAIEDYTEGLLQLPENKTFLMNKAIAEGDIKDFDSAENTYNILIGYHPKFDNAYLGRAQLYLAKGDTTKALADVDKTLELSKSNTNAYIIRAEIRSKKEKNYEGAQADLNEAIKLEPKNAGNFVNRAFLKYNQNDYFGAMADYDYAIGLDPNNVAAHFNRGLLLAEVRSAEKAISDFTFVINHDPLNIGARYNRAEQYANMGRFKEAVEDYDVVLSKVDDMPGLYFARSECKRRAGDVKGGREDYDYAQNMIDEFKRNPRANANIKPEDLASIEESEDDVKSKFKTLVTVNNDSGVKPEYDNKSRGRIQNNDFDIDAEPQFVLTYYFVDDELRGGSHYSREVADLNDAKILPSPLTISSELPQLSVVDINKHFDLISYYTDKITQDETVAVNFFARGMEYFTVKNYTAAVSDFDKAIELSDRFMLAYFARANVRLLLLEMDKMKSVDDATTGIDVKSKRMLQEKKITQTLIEINKDLDKVLELSPDMLYAFYNKGCVYLEMQDNTSAISAFSKAIEMKPDFGEAYYNRGLTYFRLGNKDNGISDLSKAGEYGIIPSYSVLKKMTR